MGENLLQSLLSGFYASVEIDTVPEIRRREFGTGTFGKKISSRHISFRSSAELNSFLREKQPFFISYSPALYERPSSTPMGNKGLIGADLVYEFDADDLKTP
ncbi:MAG TPA: DNA primase catalytic subunit PriS, partial [archaeon]|nr:DNA primase catalytic subunit PriS [archaeon]